MADKPNVKTRTVAELEGDLKQVTAQTQAAYDRLHGGGTSWGTDVGPSGIQGQYLGATKRNDPKELAKVKAKYDAAVKTYNDLQAKKNAAEAALAAGTKEADKAASIKPAQEAAQKAADAIKDAETVHSSSPAEYERVYQAAIDANTAVVKAGGKAVPLRPPLPNTAAEATAKTVDGTGATGSSTDFNWKQFAVDTKGAVQGPYTTADGKTAIGQVVIIPIKSADGKSAVPQVFNDGTKAAAAYVKAYYPTGDTNKLTQDLLNAHYITPQEATSGTLTNGILSLLSNWSSHAIQDTVVLGKKEPTFTLDKFLAERNMNTTGMGTPQRVITTRGDAKKMLDNYLVDLVGRPSTADEEKNFYAQLNSAENKAVQTTTNGTTVGSVLSDADRLMIAAQVASKALKGTDAETLLNSKTPGQLASEVKSLMSTASDYGVPLSASEALGRLTQNLGQKNYLQAQAERIKQTAIAVHPYLADHIKAGGTVKDVADVYAQQHTRKLGTVIPDSTANKDVMSALARGVSLDQYDRELQAKPEWRTTAEAHKVANDFANNILSSFGFGG